jgi:hypothetical protein
MNPAIVINAYNRPGALERLLRSIQAASYPPGGAVPLVISLDDAANQPEVARVAGQFEWTCGPKEVIRRERRLGLKAHFYACGDLSEQYERIIYLEDDLLVSPVFYPFASQALDFYQADERVAGVSLYSLWFNGYTRQPFAPWLDDADIFFLQLPYTQGEAFTARQWQSFRSGLRADGALLDRSRPLHESWSRFAANEWFPEWTAHLVASDRFFVYPRASLTTGMGEAGSHFSRPSAQFQAPLLHEKQAFALKDVDASAAVYDSFFEMLPACLNRLTGRFEQYDYCLDLYATRTPASIPADYVLTTRRCRKPLFSFGRSLWPLEANVVEGLPGEGISFCRKEDLRWDPLASLQTAEANRAYFSRGQAPSLRAWTRSKLARLLRRF